ncbi:uncharacterized protein KY384_006145 [Bacidia gigantensis]|uniref:uncharacterized protein n=1 Tax=Bacidia gigantensis TaxID=2732470 RepID=UPI001D047E3C|nr:uncharacterized protein KY384_006145 [Bacidia gigantensis]KAG8529508.1 hypothetical protein KY384_006145 [Bacidia gigantensis]
MPRADSLRVPGQHGRPSLLNTILTGKVQSLPKELSKGHEWRPMRIVGKGAYGSVILWEKVFADGRIIRLASKDSQCLSFFRDYCSEGHLTRRLNDVGCRNVISVVEWMHIDKTVNSTFDRVVHDEKPKNRICYEFARYSDLQRLESWYKSQKLILPEAFIWHVLYSVANALCYCRHGANTYPLKAGWDAIVHGDIKQANLFLTKPDDSINALYPCIKLADFGLAYTTGGSVAAVQHYRSRLNYGTDGYIAPEIEDHTPESTGRRRMPRELHGPHSDVYSLGMTCKHLLSLVQLYKPPTAGHVRSSSNSTLAGLSENLESFYSLELRTLLDLCVAHDPRDRPKTSRLYMEAKAQMERHQEIARNEAMAARRGESQFKLFHSGILYTQEDQVRYETDSTFRQHYERANLERLRALIDEQQLSKTQHEAASAKTRPIFDRSSSDKGKEKSGKEREIFTLPFMKRLK